MYIYNYKAYRGKAIIQGEILGETKEEIVTYLREHALTPIYITKKKGIENKRERIKSWLYFLKNGQLCLRQVFP